MSISRRLADLYGDVEEHDARSGADDDAVASADVLRVALWQLDSAAPIDPGLMIRAAQQAQRTRDWALAERFARVALEREPSVDASVLLSQSLISQGDYAESADVLAAALEGAGAQQVDDDLRAELLSGRAWALFWDGRVSQAERELAEAAGSVSTAAAHDVLLAHSSMFVLLGGRPAEALEIAEPLLESDDLRVYAEAATTAALAMALSGRTSTALDVADQGLHALADSARPGEVVDTDALVAARALAAGEAGLVELAVDTTVAAHAHAVTQDLVDGQAWFALLRGRALHLAGDLEAAALSFTEGAVLFHQLDRAGLERWCHAGLAWCEAQRGAVQEAAEALEALDALGETGVGMMEVDVDRARAAVAVAAGRRDDAETILAGTVAAGRAVGACSLVSGAAFDLVRLGAVERGSTALREITAAVDGELATTRLEAAEAIDSGDPEALVAQADRFEAMGVRLLAAELLAHAAAAHRARGDRRAADGCSLRCAALARECGGAHTPALLLAGAAAELTRRERQIAELASGGLSNAEIAERLEVSVRTVANQLQRAYEKLGINGRGELAGALELVE
jgi:DNA-binding CsgD family transcriptional regulator